MINLQLAVVVFAIAGFSSGICSGLSTVFKPMGIIAPGILFGVALACASHLSIMRLSTTRHAIIVAATTGSYVAAGAASLFSTGIFGLGNNLLHTAYVGAIGGGCGAGIIAFTIQAMIPLLSPQRTLAFITLAGSNLGAAFAFAIYIHDHYTFVHPHDYIVGFALWQTGVASVVPLCKKDQIDMPA